MRSGDMSEGIVVRGSGPERGRLQLEGSQESHIANWEASGATLCLKKEYALRNNEELGLWYQIRYL